MNAISIGAGEFKTHCLKILDNVAQTQQTVVITKHGKPVAQLQPIAPERPLFGLLSGSVTQEHDIISPLENDWAACDK